MEGVRQHVFDRLTAEQVAQLGVISDALAEGLRAEADGEEACPEAG